MKEEKEKRKKKTREGKVGRNEDPQRVSLRVKMRTEGEEGAGRLVYNIKKV